MYFAPPAPTSQPRSGRLWHTTAFRMMAAATAVLATAALLVVSLAIRSTNDAMSRATIADLDREGTALRLVHARDGVDALGRRIGEQIASGDGYLYRLTAAGGRRLAGNLRENPSFRDEASGGGTFRYAIAAPGESGSARTRLAAGRVYTLTGDTTLIVARDIEAQRHFLSHTNWTLGLGVAALALVGLGAGVLLSRHILGRVDAMTAASRSIMAGNLAQRLPRSGSSDELDRLADSLNTMLDRIELLMAGMKEVSSNVAHDLKTPLTRIKAMVEAALRSERPDDYRAALERTVDESDRLLQTFNALLSIARAEAGQARSGLEAVDAGMIIEDVAELYEPMVEEQGGSLKIEMEPGLLVRADRQLLAQALSNLIDNALKYGGHEERGAEITVKGAVSNNQVVISVGDHGIGIAPEDRGRVTERFVRLDASRARPGNGLGLSLVSGVMKLHEGTLVLEDNNPGLLAKLVLPLHHTPG